MTAPPGSAMVHFRSSQESWRAWLSWQTALVLLASISTAVAGAAFLGLPFRVTPSADLTSVSSPVQPPVEHPFAPSSLSSHRTEADLASGSSPIQPLVEHPSPAISLPFPRAEPGPLRQDGHATTNNSTSVAVSAPKVVVGDSDAEQRQNGPEYSYDHSWRRRSTVSESKSSSVNSRPPLLGSISAAVHWGRAFVSERLP
jgi:hypothetical protein